MAYLDYQTQREAVEQALQPAPVTCKGCKMPLLYTPEMVSQNGTTYCRSECVKSNTNMAGLAWGSTPKPKRLSRKSRQRKQPPMMSGSNER